MLARPQRKGQDTGRPKPPREEGKFPRGFPPEHGDIAKEANETPEGSTGTNGRRAVSQVPQRKTPKTSMAGPEISFTDEVRPTSVNEISGPTLDESEGPITQEIGFPPELGDIAKEANETPEGNTGKNGRRAVSQGPQEKTRKTSKVGPEISFTDEVRPTSVKEISGPTLDEAEGSPPRGNDVIVIALRS